MGFPGNNNYCDGKCTSCNAPETCNFKFNGMGQKPTCACGAATPPRTRPTGPRPTFNPHRPTRSMKPGMMNCADIHGAAAGSTPEDEDSCENWELCKNHRRTPVFVPVNGDTDASCCCNEPTGSSEPANDKSQFCCAIPDAPEPTASCSGIQAMSCGKPFFAATKTCLPTIAESMDCNILAPESSKAFQDCTVIFNCMKKAFGPTFGTCCNCINYFAVQFKQPQFQIDCDAA